MYYWSEMRKFLYLLLSFLFLKTVCSRVSNSQEPSSKILWYQRVQIYSMVALGPADVERFHIKVNGLWNGYFGGSASPFAFGRVHESLASGKRYSSDEEFVNVQHSKGLLVPATILTSQGRKDMQGPRLPDYACRSYDGALPDFDPEAKSHFMCANKPAWVNWMRHHGEQAIDAGADLIVLDEIQGNGFFPKFQWLSPYLKMKEPGFCPYCINEFKSYLKHKYTASQLLRKYNISDIDKVDLAARIASVMHLPYKERVAAEPLTTEYIDFQTEKNFYAKTKLIKALREYARGKGRKIAISANVFALGTERGGGYWVKGLIFSDFVDFLSFENTYTAVEDRNILPFPRNKWVAWEKLARSAINSPFVIIPDTGEIKEIVQNNLTHGKSYKNYLYIHFAEAYANRGAFAFYYIYNWGNRKEWEKCAKAAEFILKHRALYEMEPDRSDIAIVVLYSEALYRRIFSYLGLAQVLAESSIPFDVVFGGGGKYLRDRLNFQRLSGYKLIFVPSAIGITENQTRVIKQYVKKGGKAIIFDGKPFGLSGQGVFPYGQGAFLLIPAWNYQGEEWDIGNLYFLGYEDSVRKTIADLVEQLLPGASVLKNPDRKVVAYPYYSSAQRTVVVHLLNYDHDLKTDRVVPKSNLVLRIKRPEFPPEENAILLSPDTNEVLSLKTTYHDDHVEIIIPHLEVYSLVVLRGKKISQSR